MSLLEEFKIAEKIPKGLKNNIKLYHVFKDECNEEVYENVLFVTNDDKVYGLGYNGSGRLGLIQTEQQKIPPERVERPEEVVELSGKGIEQFFISTKFALGLSSDGNLYSWGCNQNCVLGRTSSPPKTWYKPGPIELFGEIDIKIKQVCCCDQYVLVLLDNEIVLVWGHMLDVTGSLYNVSCGGMSMMHQVANGAFKDGQYMNGNIETPQELISVTSGESYNKSDTQGDLQSIFSNGCRFFALYSDNQVYSWGRNCTPYLGQQSSYPRLYKPTLISLLAIYRVKIIDIACIDIAAYFLSDWENGSLYVCGNFVELGQKANQYPTLIESDQKFTQMERIDNKTVICINDKQIVYELKRKRVIETEFKSFEEYSVRKRGITYKTFKAEFPQLMASTDKSLSKSMEVINISDDKLMCKICCKSEVQSVAVPCGHTLCNACSLGSAFECPFCRSRITSIIKLKL